MKRMWDTAELTALIQEVAPGFDPSDIPEGDVLQNAVLGLNADGEAVKGNLFGKYVKIIAPPSSNILTEEEWNNIKNGAVINESYLGYKNPMLCPASLWSPGYFYGLFIAAQDSGVATITFYQYEESTKKIGVSSNYSITLGRTSEGNGLAINGKKFPAYPANTEYKALLCNGGSLQWIDLMANIAPQFSDATTYAEGDLCIYKGVLYKCSNNAGHTGAWDAADFTQTTLAEVIAAL